MLYVFKSKASGSVLMTGDIAQQVLTTLGRALTPEGVITSEQLTDAVNRLRAAINRSKAEQGGTTPEDDEGTPIPGFAQRAFPMLALLERAQQAQQVVTWGPDSGIY